MPSLRDRCCSRATQNNSKRWLMRLAIGFAAGIVLAAIVVIVLCFAVIPDLKASIEDARLNIFAFATTPSVGTTSSFAYNISVALTVRNPNRAMGIKYTKPLMATLLFYDRRLYNVSVADEGHKHLPRKREVHLLHAGGEVQSYVLDTAAVEEFKKQNATGVFEVELRLSGELMLGIGKKRKLHLSCPLRLQLAPPGPEVILFHEVDCNPDKPDKIYF